ncbi:MAG TPA: adenylate/guanylate cyclase domain-containing protein, partial [Alphaproteobacteria bacterium]|nr:adenylate/guanylate cyclase domain-containing protein [Alphaproteobacteria bacterium]
MERQGVTRRLAAILAADVAGYTRLMELDEETTLAAWWRARREVIDPDIAAHGGRIVKHTGDGFLAEFTTVTEAVKCAAGMQQKLAPLAAGMSRDKRLEFRMGINLGDIVVDDEDIYGDGVNLAARIEGLAEAGGICLSADVYNQVHKRLDYDFEDLGERRVKNVSEPLHVYRLLLGGRAAEKPSRPLWLGR